MSAPIVTLGWNEIWVGAHSGLWRNLHSRQEGYTHLVGMRGPGWHENIEGALAEQSLARWRNRYWAKGPDGRLDEGDVGRAQVRWTDHPNGRLIVRPGDLEKHADAAYVFVRGQVPTYRLEGWIWCRDAPRLGKLEDPDGRGPAYFIPVENLTPLGDK